MGLGVAEGSKEARESSPKKATENSDSANAAQSSKKRKAAKEGPSGEEKPKKSRRQAPKSTIVVEDEDIEGAVKKEPIEKEEGEVAV